MKRMIVLLFVFALLIGLCACETPVASDMTAPTQATTVPIQTKPSEKLTEQPTEPTKASTQAATNQPTNCTAKVSGAFTVTVWQTLPDYLLDNTTPIYAVVAQYQSSPFVLNVGHEIASQLEVGKAYVFTVNTMFANYSIDFLNCFETDTLFALIPGLRVTGFRLAEENEIGLDSLHLTIE